MEADQNQEVPEAVSQTNVAETESPVPEQPKSDEVNETPSVQAPPEPEKPAEESTGETPEVEPAKESASSETAVEPEKSPEKEEVAEEAVKVEKPAEMPAEVENKPEVVVVEQQVAEPEQKVEPEPEKKAEPEPEKKAEPAPEQKVESEKKPESEQKEEPKQPAANDAAPAEAEKSEAKTAEAEQEKPSEGAAQKEVEAQPKEPELPMFYGWFLLAEVEEKIKCSTMEFLKTLDTLEAFKKHIGDFTGDVNKEVDLEQFFQTSAPLHCTTQFCDYGKSEGSKEYAELQVVKDSNNTTTELSVVGLIVTPRTFGARVSLTPEQLSLWPTGADKVGIPPADLPGVEALPVGSRAHVTLGCAANVEAVQTGIDLLEILIFQQGEEKPATVEELELGTLSYLGKGRWYLSLREKVTCDATFSSFSEKQRVTEPAKKEGGEKKKKPKCSIL